MKTPNAQAIRTKLDERRERRRAEMRRQEEAMDAFAVEAVRVLTAGLGVEAEDREPAAQEAAADPTTDTALQARHAVEARRLEAPTTAPAGGPEERTLRAALRGVVADYAAPLAPSDRAVGALEALSGIGAGEADSAGTWADRQLQAALAVRAEMPHLIDAVSATAESVIIAELVAAAGRLASEHPDAPRPYASDAGVAES